MMLLSHHFQVQTMFRSVPEIQHTRTTVLHAGEDMDEGENQLYALTIITHQSDLLVCKLH